MLDETRKPCISRYQWQRMIDAGLCDQAIGKLHLQPELSQVQTHVTGSLPIIGSNFQEFELCEHRRENLLQSRVAQQLRENDRRQSERTADKSRIDFVDISTS